MVGREGGGDDDECNRFDRPVIDVDLGLEKKRKKERREVVRGSAIVRNNSGK